MNDFGIELIRDDNIGRRRRHLLEEIKILTDQQRNLEENTEIRKVFLKYQK